MKRKTWLKIIIVPLLIFIVVAYMYPPLLQSIYTSLGYSSAYGNQIFLILVVLGICGAVLAILWPLIQNKYNLGVLKASFGASGDKIYPLKDNVKAALEYMEPSGISSYSLSNGGAALHVISTMVDSEDSDTPFVIISLSTAPTRMNYKTMHHETGEHGIHFMVVNRKSNEVSYDPDINTIKEAIEFKDKLRADALPIELKKSKLDKATDAMVDGFYNKLGQDSANTEGKKEDVNNESKT